jgi:hypothetical protein
MVLGAAWNQRDPGRLLGLELQALARALSIREASVKRWFEHYSSVFDTGRDQQQLLHASEGGDVSTNGASRHRRASAMR